MAVAEPAKTPELRRADNWIEAQAHFGVARSPFDVSSLPVAEGQAFVFLMARCYSFSNLFALELDVPLVLGSVAQPAGAYVDAAAVGNPELGARYRFLARRSGDDVLALFGSLGVGAPLASHDAGLMPNRLLAIADGIEGRGDPQWFTPGVVPFTPSTWLHWDSVPWTLDAELRTPMSLRVSDADLPAAAANPRTFGVAGIIAVELRYRLSQRLSLGSKGQMFFDVLSPVEHVREVSPVQVFERLSLLIHLGSSATLLVDLQTALAGELGGSTFGGGLRARMTME